MLEGDLEKQRHLVKGPRSLQVPLSGEQLKRLFIVVSGEVFTKKGIETLSVITVGASCGAHPSSNKEIFYLGRVSIIGFARSGEAIVVEIDGNPGRQRLFETREIRSLKFE